jgi:REP-associated tyrosine transposase
MYHPHRLSFYDGFGNHRHFLTICTYRRRKYFKHQLVVAITWKQILRAARARSFVVSAYCFMPDHLHVLVHGESDDSDLRAFIRLAKQMSSYQFLRFSGRKLWRGSYWDRTLRGATTDVIRYIVANPVKAGLVSHPLDYPFWGSQIYTREELLDLIAIDGRPDL